MNKIERIKAVINGDEVDRLPYSFWYHFGLQHMPGEKHAEAEIDFFRAYDLDFLKVMSDHRHPFPAGIDVLETEDDWKRIEPLGGDHPWWREQLKALSIINNAIGKEAFFIETIFSPWTTARRLTRSESMSSARKRFPEAVLKAMDNISSTLADYSREVIARGAAGIFLSLGAATDEVMTEEEYETWCRPFDLKILDAVKDAQFNVLHIHGSKIHFDPLMDYHVPAINWSHYYTGPGLREGQARSGRTVMGGINETNTSHVSSPEIFEQVVETIREIGMKRLIITPGCAIPTDTPVSNLRAVRSAIDHACKRG